MLHNLNCNNKTPLLMLCEQSKNDENYELIKLFLEKGADPNVLDCHKYNSLQNLISGKNPKSIRLLLEYDKSNIECKNEISEKTWREYYLDYFIENKITIPPLKEDSEYEWLDEYDRVINYKFWDLFKNINIMCKIIKNRFTYFVKLPKEIINLVNLEELDICHNKIEEIQDEIFELVNLKKIFLGCNEIKKIPTEIKKLINLKVLGLNSNLIEEIPREIGNLIELEVLWLDRNQIKKIPEEIANLTNLRQIHIDKNQIEEISVKITKIKDREGIDFRL